MFIDVKIKISRMIDGKVRKRIETYFVDKEFFSEAEYAVTSALTEEQEGGLVEEFEIQSLRISPIRELVAVEEGMNTFVATLKDIFHEDDGTEKVMKYKVLLWADDLTQANHKVQELAREGYDMLIEGIKQVDYTYIHEEEEHV